MWGALPSAALGALGSPHAWGYKWCWQAGCAAPAALRRFRQPKKSAEPEEEAQEGVGQGTTLLSPVSGIQEPRFPGRISPRRRAAAAGRAAEANFAEWLLFKNNSAFVSRSGLLQIE